MWLNCKSILKCEYIGVPKVFNEYYINGQLKAPQRKQSKELGGPDDLFWKC